MEDKREAMSHEEKRESGMPGGGQGRRDEVGQTPVYPLSSGEMPQSDEYIRTPGELGQRGRGLEGYNDSGASEAMTMPPGQSGGSQQAQASSGQEDSGQPISPHREGSEPGQNDTAASGMVDVDADMGGNPGRF